MGRYLLLGLTIWAVFIITRHLIRRNHLNRETSSSERSVDSVQCAYCGLHLPRAEAIHSGDDFFCTSSHARLAKKTR